MKRILYDMGNSSGYFLTPSLRWERVVSILVGCQGWGWGVIFMSLVFYMFQSILNIFGSSQIFMPSCAKLVYSLIRYRLYSLCSDNGASMSMTPQMSVCETKCIYTVQFTLIHNCKIIPRVPHVYSHLLSVYRPSVCVPPYIYLRCFKWDLFAAIEKIKTTP